ncbi:MAG: gamma carbonic anhydrase family protein [Syntrophomonadaceae bacterium]|nr:gamma carbonic anhydrase family protein [Syntrophomonadaceae bacterium]MDH7497053.1 gamma carbonic anhydrase family protein [Syntrophomonadaceae bacterium]
MRYEFDGRSPQVSPRAYVSETALVIGDVVVGDHCYIGHGAILRGDYGRIEIGEGTAVEEGVIIHAPPGETCRIGRRVTMGHGAIVHCAEIGDGATIGMGAVASLGAVIGAGAIVAEGAVVKGRDVVPERVVVAGSPARVVRPVQDKDVEWWDWAKQLYVDLAEKYLRVGMRRLD